MGSLSLLQWIVPTQELNQGLLHCRQILYPLSYKFITNLYLTVLEAEKSKIKVLADLVSGEGYLLRTYTVAFLLCSHVVERVRDSSGHFCRGTNPIHGVRAQRRHFRIPSSLKLGF